MKTPAAEEPEDEPRNVPAEPDDSIPTPEEFARLWDDLIERVAEIARLYVRALDKFGYKYRQQCVQLGLSSDLLARIEMLGRGQIDERLVWGESKAKRLLTHYPISEQQRILDEGLEVLGPDETSVRRIPFEALTPKQAITVLGRDRQLPLSIAEQRTLIQEEKAKAIPAEITPPMFDVRRDYVLIKQPLKVPKKLLRQWLEMMQ